MTNTRDMGDAMVCPHCGKNTLKGASQCGHCGTPVRGATRSDRAALRLLPDGDAPWGPGEKGKPRKRGKNIGLATLIAIVVGVNIFRRIGHFVDRELGHPLGPWVGSTFLVLLAVGLIVAIGVFAKRRQAAGKELPTAPPSRPDVSWSRASGRSHPRPTSYTSTAASPDDHPALQDMRENTRNTLSKFIALALVLTALGLIFYMAAGGV